MAETGTEQKGQNIQYGIRAINVETFHKEDNPQGNNPLTFTIRISINFNPNENRLTMLPEGKFIEKETENELIKIGVSTVYEIKELENFVSEQEGEKKLNLPDELMFNLASMAMDHARAILSQKLLGSEYENLVLPVIDPANILKKQG